MVGLSHYLGLFLSAFVAATVLPAQSEAVLVGLLTLEKLSVIGLVTVASVGNILGSAMNYVLGWFAEKLKDRRWFPVSPQTLDRSAKWYAKYGRWSLLLSWVPIIGDPITVAAGLMREPFWRFLVFVTFAKTCRYVILAAFVLHWI